MSQPAIASVAVYPVAGRDSMELNLSGAHAPYFTRNMVVLDGLRGPDGLGEVPGGEKITQTLRDAESLVVGANVGRLQRVLREIRTASPTATPAGAACRPSTCAPPSTSSPRSSRRCSTCWASTSTCRSRRCWATASSGTRADARLPVLHRRPRHDRPGLPARSRRRRRLVPDPARGGADPGDDRPPGRGHPRPATASRTSSSRAACWPATRRSRPSARSRSGFPRPGSPSTPTAPGRCARRSSCAGPARRARLRRGPLRRRGRLLRSRDPGRVPPRHRAADRDQHDRHRLAAADPRAGPAQRRHPAGRPALLDHAGLGPGGPAVQRRWA